jgi:hypothetical protein
MKTICQECGKELNTWGETHTYQMCGNYHLQRAEEILGFSLRNMEIYKKELTKYTEENKKVITNLVTFHDYLLKALDDADVMKGNNSKEFHSIVAVLVALGSIFDYPFLKYNSPVTAEQSNNGGK